ncbi:MAG: CinA family nicotinamide mononucleotide deamidase-related protein [Bacteroidetes bacterium]|nr:CinA family nicotinamide mononucleotide deamidase-related protein [Bacteroidota bacterium]
MPLCTILTIGDEILIGQTIDTNSAWIGQQLNGIGAKVHEIISVSDNADHIKDGLRRAARQSEIVLITGGLGPTKDDITKKTLCEYFEVGEVFHEDIFEHLKTIFAKRGLAVLEINKKQALLPMNCTVVPNERGTAPGMWFDEGGVIYVSMPGVPHEMKHMVTNHVLPRLAAQFKFPHIIHRNLMLCGIGESSAAKLLDEFENKLPQHIKLAYLPDLGILKLRLSAYEVTTTEGEAEIDQYFAEMKGIMKEYAYAEEDIKLEELIGRLFLERDKKFALAESCTGGYAGHLVTSIAGSSRYFEGSTVTYSYDMKQTILGVKPETLANQGAVSEQCVKEMLEGLLKISKADYGVSVSGIAGPDGGTPDKPVGTVCFAVGDRNKIVTKTYQFFPRRMENIRISSVTALNLLRKFVLGELE